MTTAWPFWDWLQTMAWVMGRSPDAIRFVEEIRREEPSGGHEAEVGAFGVVYNRDAANFRAAENEVFAACASGRISGLGRSDGDLENIPATHWDRAKVYLHQGEYALGHEALGAPEALRRTEWFGLRFRSDDVRRLWPHPDQTPLLFLAHTALPTVRMGDAIQLAVWDRINPGITTLDGITQEEVIAITRGHLLAHKGLSDGSLRAFALSADNRLVSVPREYWLTQRPQHPFLLSSEGDHIGWRDDLRAAPLLVAKGDIQADWAPALAEAKNASSTSQARAPWPSRKSETLAQALAWDFFAEAARVGLMAKPEYKTVLYGRYVKFRNDRPGEKGPQMALKTLTKWGWKYLNNQWPGR